MRWIVMYLAIAVPLLIADGVWLGLVAKRFYREALGPLMAPQIKLLPAVLFYLGYPVGLVIFALMPALAGGGFTQALLAGGLFGLFCYGTYDLVNQATLRGWPLRLTLVDMTWGTGLSAAAAGLAFWMLA
jgi:uncharacterized membrane protein